MSNNPPLNPTTPFNSFFSPRPVWIFNPWLDLLCFGAPLLAALLFSSGVPVQKIILFKFGLDAGHIFATAVPIVFSTALVRISYFKLLLFGCGVILALLLVSWINFDYFKIALGYYALFHMVTQLYGWLVILQKSGPTLTNYRRRLDKALFAFLILMPLAYWHAGKSAVPLSYFYEHNLVLPVADFWWKFLSVALVLTFLAWVGVGLKDFFLYRKQPHLGKCMLYIFICVTFAGGLVILQDVQLFWTCLVLNHGLSYIIHILVHSRRNDQALPYENIGGRTLSLVIYFSVLFVMGYLSVRLAREVGLYSTFAVLGWTPLLLHYSIDAILWKRKRLRHFVKS